MTERPRINLNELTLEAVRAHGGEGNILFHRVFCARDFESPCNFVDYAIVPPGGSIGVHTHGSNEEIYLVLAGEGVMHLDGREFRVGPGAVVKNEVNGTHGLRNDGAEPLRLFVVEIAIADRRAGVPA